MLFLFSLWLCGSVSKNNRKAGVALCLGGQQRGHDSFPWQFEDTVDPTLTANDDAAWHPYICICCHIIHSWLWVHAFVHALLTTYASIRVTWGVCVCVCVCGMFTLVLQWTFWWARQRKWVIVSIYVDIIATYLCLFCFESSRSPQSCHLRQPDSIMFKAKVHSIHFLLENLMFLCSAEAPKGYFDRLDCQLTYTSTHDCLRTPEGPLSQLYWFT